MQESGRCLIFDADDTLWENNIYFEAAIEEFLEAIGGLIGLSNAVAPDRRAVLALLNEIERESIPRCGYGSRHFVNSLRETFSRIYSGGDGVAYHRAIDKIAQRLISHPMAIMPHVPETLETLRRRYRLLMFTKGDYEEQASKAARSGLEHHFHAVEITGEKDPNAYHQLVERHALNRETTFMIGNSPRSDVLPALAAGLWAVFVPHAHTWDLEHEEVPPHPRLITVNSVRELPALLEQMFPEQV